MYISVFQYIILYISNIYIKLLLAGNSQNKLLLQQYKFEVIKELFIVSFHIHIYNVKEVSCSPKSLKHCNEYINTDAGITMVEGYMSGMVNIVKCTPVYVQRVSNKHLLSFFKTTSLCF